MNPKTVGRFAHDQIKVSRVETARFKDFAVHDTDRARGRHDAISPGLEHSRVARMSRCARACDICPIGEQLDIDFAFNGRKTRFVNGTANRYGYGGTYTCVEGCFNGRRIDNGQECAALVIVFKQALENGIAIARCAGRCGIGSVGKDGEAPGFFGQADGIWYRGEWRSEMVAIVPHVLGDAFGFALCAFGIVVGKDNDVGAQVGYIGEGIADIYTATQAPFGIFYFLAPADGLTKSSGFGDEFVASHEHGQSDMRDGGFDIAIEKSEQVARTRCPVSYMSMCGYV